MEDLERDPRKFATGLSPAVVAVKQGNGETEQAGFANVSSRESGALFCEEWTGDRILLPAWRWIEVRFIETERFDYETEDGRHRQRKRIPAGEWGLIPEEVRDEIDSDAQEVEIA